MAADAGDRAGADIPPPPCPMGSCLAQHHGYPAAGDGVMDVDGQEAALVVVGAEQRQLLVAVGHVQGVAYVKGDGLGLEVVDGAPGINRGVGEPYDSPQARRVLPVRDRRLRAQIAAAVGQPPRSQPERRIAPQAVQGRWRPRSRRRLPALARAESNPANGGRRPAREGRRSAASADQYADRSVGQGQQCHAAIGSDATAIEGRADFLTRHAWQIDQETGIVNQGGRSDSVTWNSVGVSNQNLLPIGRLRCVRQPVFRPGVNKTG